ncbi:hypothetical protein N9D66_00025 [Candidatus Nanopelagicales bacterium]|nr:hypothetical protein [Candidatus Nanopelagicales bacterium]
MGAHEEVVVASSCVIVASNTNPLADDFAAYIKLSAMPSTAVGDSPDAADQ